MPKALHPSKKKVRHVDPFNSLVAGVLAEAWSVAKTDPVGAGEELTIDEWKKLETDFKTRKGSIPGATRVVLARHCNETSEKLVSTFSVTHSRARWSRVAGYPEARLGIVFSWTGAKETEKPPIHKRLSIFGGGGGPGDRKPETKCLDRDARESFVDKHSQSTLKAFTKSLEEDTSGGVGEATDAQWYQQLNSCGPQLRRLTNDAVNEIDHTIEAHSRISLTLTRNTQPEISQHGLIVHVTPTFATKNRSTVLRLARPLVVAEPLSKILQDAVDERLRTTLSKPFNSWIVGRLTRHMDSMAKAMTDGLNIPDDVATAVEATARQYHDLFTERHLVDLTLGGFYGDTWNHDKMSGLNTKRWRISLPDKSKLELPASDSEEISVTPI